VSKRPASSGALPVINEYAAAIDIGSRFNVAAVAPDLCKEAVQTFQAFTADTERMADWFLSLGIKTVAMESTGVYWVPVYEILETRGLHVIVANARDARSVPGARAMSTTRSGFSDFMLADCYAPAFGRVAISRHSARICGFENDISNTLLPISSTCRSH
jgi:hypothetical protein